MEGSPVSAYVIVAVSIKDLEGFRPYLEAAPPVIAAHGGRYLARGGALDVFEGDWTPPRLTIVEFAHGRPTHARTGPQRRRWT
jgi:uncharacterized protein (DUF1330 family)